MYLDVGDTVWKLHKCSELIGQLSSSDQEQRDLLYTCFVVLLHAVFEKTKALTTKLSHSHKNLSGVIAGYSVNESHVQQATEIVERSKKPDKMRQYFVHATPKSPWSVIEEDSTLWTMAPVGFPAAPAVDRAVSVTVNHDVEFGVTATSALERVEQIFGLLNKAVSSGTT